MSDWVKGTVVENFDEVPEGHLVPRLSRLGQGDSVWVSAAAGRKFTLETIQSARTLWLLATGTALGVYFSILRTPDAWRMSERVILVHRVRNKTFAETKLSSRAWSTLPLREAS